MEEVMNYEKIEIQVKSSLGIDFDNGGFLF